MMDKENFFDDESDSEDEERAMVALPDSDIDDIENQLKNMHPNDDDNTYLHRAIDKMLKPMNNVNKNYESEEYSDDDLIYPNDSIISSSNSRQNNNDDWILVEPDHDQRPKTLPKFNEKVGPTFPVGSGPLPATFYNEMLPDSLFDHIVMCTNTRARVYFDSISSTSDIQTTWKLVTRDEMKKFVAIIVHMGRIRKRSITDYWSTDSYLVTPIFHSPQYLSRNRFFFILR
ncbi:unnamed protein product, partial [Rotaria magnacalcarata]